MSRSPKSKAHDAPWPTSRWPASPWHDGDTSLLFGVVVAICGILILWRALDPGNWQVLADEPPAHRSAVPSVCPPSAAR